MSVVPKLGSEGDAPVSPIWLAVLAATVLLVLAFFLYAVRGVLNPFLLYLVLLAVLHPFRGRPGHTLLTGLVTVVTLFWVLESTGFLLAPFVLALGLAYVLDPLVDLVVERGLNRSVAILLLALPVVGGLVVGIVVGLPALGEQVAELIDRVPVLLRRLADWIEGLDDRVEALSLPPFLQDMVERLREVDPEAMVAFLQERQADIVRRTWQGVLGLGRGLTSFLSVVGYVVLTPVLTFYLLRDWDGLTKGVAELLPADRRDGILDFAGEYDHLLSRYLRGQLLVALLVGTITAVGLWIVSFPYALLLGVLVAVFGLIPYLGLVLSLVPAILIALVSGSVLTSLLKVGVVYGVAQALEGSVISPRIVGESVGLHPVWVVLALSIGGFYFGFVGLLLGVPGAVGVKLIAQRGLERYRASELYGEPAQADGPAGDSAPADA